MLIYKITNKINGKVYIGQTISDTKTRWGQHCSLAKRGGFTSNLHNAIRKYKKENFTVEIITTCSNLNILNKYEEILISKYNTLSPNGYNLKLGGQNYKICKESKIRMSKAQGGKPFLVRNLKTDEIMEFETQADCSQQLGLSQGNIGSCLRENRYSAKNYSFVYQNNGVLPPTKNEIEKSKAIGRLKTYKSRQIVARNLNTDQIVEFKSLSQCSRGLGIDHRSIGTCLKDKILYCGKYTFSYKDSNKLPLTKEKIKKIRKIRYIKGCGEGEFVCTNIKTGKTLIFQSQAECARQLGLSQGNIGSCLSDRRNMTKGYSFSYKD